MATEVPRCSDCGTALKSIPSWLAGAKVNFTCSACPRRSVRSAAAIAPRAVEIPTRLVAADPDLEDDDAEEIDEDVELDLSADELDDVKDDAEI